MVVWHFVGLLAGYAVAAGMGLTVGVICLAYVHPLAGTRYLSTLDHELGRRGWGAPGSMTPEQIAKHAEAWARATRASAVETERQFDERIRILRTLAGVPSDRADIDDVRAIATTHSDTALTAVTAKLAACPTVDSVLDTFPSAVRTEVARLWIAGMRDYLAPVSKRIIRRLVRAIELCTVGGGVLAVAAYPFVYPVLPDAWDWPTFIGWCVALGLATATTSVLASEISTQYAEARDQLPPLRWKAKAAFGLLLVLSVAGVFAVHSGGLTALKDWANEQAGQRMEQASPSVVRIVGLVCLLAFLAWIFVRLVRHAANRRVVSWKRVEAASGAAALVALMVASIGFVALPSDDPALSWVVWAAGFLMIGAAVGGGLLSAAMRTWSAHRWRHELAAAGVSVDPERFKGLRAAAAAAFVTGALPALSIATRASQDPGRWPLLQLAVLVATGYVLVQLFALASFNDRTAKAYEAHARRRG